MLTNLFILLFSFFGLGKDAGNTGKPAPNSKPGTEVPKPSKYDNEKGGKQPGGGWDLN